VGRVSYGTSQQPQQHLFQPATFLAPDSVVTPFTYVAATLNKFHQCDELLDRNLLALVT